MSLAHFGSLVCVVHCILTPIIIIFAPFLGHAFHSFWVEVAILGFAIVCGIFVMYQGFCKHKKKHGILIFIIGIVNWILHSIVERLHIEWLAPILLLVGTVFVLISYYLNHQYLKCCPAECCSDS